MSACASLLCDNCSNPGRCCTGFGMPVAPQGATMLEALVAMATVVVGTDRDGRSIRLDPGASLAGIVSAEVGLPFMPFVHKPNDGWRYWCPHLEKGRCSIYAERPTLCRQFKAGTDPLCCMHTPPREDAKCAR